MSTSASTQSGSLHRGEFIFGDTGMMFTAVSTPGSTPGYSPQPRLEAILNHDYRHPLMQPTVRMVQVWSFSGPQRSHSPAKVKGKPSLRET
jgi:hypothetical protein